MSCIPLPTSASNTATTGYQDNRPNPSPTHSTNNNTNGEISIDTNLTTATQVQSAITTITTNWPQTNKAMNTSSPEITIIFSVTPSVIILIALAIVLIPLLIVAYTRVKQKKSKLLKQDDSDLHTKHTKVIQVSVDETTFPPTSNGHAVSLGQGMLSRRQHMCTRVASDTVAYDGHNDAASPEPEVVVIVDNTLESSCDEERYTSMQFEHSRSHVTSSPLSCDGHMTDHLYDTIDPQPLYESVLTHSTIPQSQHSPQMKQNQNPSINSMRSHSQFQNSSSPFQRSLTIGGVYSTRTTSSLQSTSSHTNHSHRGSLTSSGTIGGVSQRMSGGGGRGSRMSHHRLSTAGGSSSRAGTSTQGSMGSGILPLQE